MGVDFFDLDNLVRKTWVYPNIGDNLIYPVLGLCGEAGEVAEKVKKLIRDHDGILTPKIELELAKELGDVLWYISATAQELGFSSEFIMNAVKDKLLSRKDRDVLHGDGDNR